MYNETDIKIYFECKEISEQEAALISPFNIKSFVMKRGNKKYPYFIQIHSQIVRVDNATTIIYIIRDGERIQDVRSIYSEEEFLMHFEKSMITINEEELALML